MDPLVLVVSCALPGLLGAFFLVWGCVRAYSVRKFVRNASRATGVIVGLERNRSGEHHEYRHPVVRFETSQGKKVEFASGFGYTKLARGAGLGPQPGQEVAVLYDPLRPEMAELEGARGMVGTPLALIAAGVACFGLLAFVLYFFLAVV